MSADWAQACAFTNISEDKRRSAFHFWNRIITNRW